MSRTRISYLCERCNRNSTMYCLECDRGSLFIENDSTMHYTNVAYNRYCEMEFKTTGEIFNEKLRNYFTIKKVHFNDPVTVVLWADGTKTIVRCQEGDTFDPEKGLAMAIAKKALGNKGNYCEVFKKWLPEEKENAETIPVVAQVMKFEQTENGIRADIKPINSGDVFFDTLLKNVCGGMSISFEGEKE